MREARSWNANSSPAFPNVFHSDFEAWCHYLPEINCRPCVGDPWLFGNFLDNELDWWGRRPGDAWIEEKSGAFLGVVAPRFAPVNARFWRNDQGGCHPDASWPVERKLGPGETLRPKRQRMTE